MSSRPARSTERVPRQAPKLHRETLSRNKQKVAVIGTTERRKMEDVKEQGLRDWRGLSEQG